MATYYFTASSERINRSYKIYNFINKPLLCRDSASLFVCLFVCLFVFHLKMTYKSYTDEVRVKVPSFQKVTILLQYQIFRRDVTNLYLCLFEDATDCRYLICSRIKSFASIKLFVSFT